MRRILFLLFFIFLNCSFFLRKESYPQTDISTQYERQEKNSELADKKESSKELYDNSSNIKNTYVQKQDYINYQNINLYKKNQIIYESNIHIQVKNIIESIENIKKIAEIYKGYIETTKIERENISTYIKLRIPVENFFNSLEELFKLGKVYSYSIFAEDVTKKLFDIESRLQILKKLRERLYELFNKINDVKEKSKILKEINRLTSEIDELETRLSYYKDKVSFSTIEIFLTTKEINSRNIFAESPFEWIKNIDPLKRTIFNEPDRVFEEVFLFLSKSEYKKFQSYVELLNVPESFFDNILNYYKGETYLFYSSSGSGIRLGVEKNEPYSNSDFWILAVKNEFMRRNYKILEEKEIKNFKKIDISINDGIKEYYYSIGLKVDQDFIIVVELFYPDKKNYEQYKEIIVKLVN